MFFIVWGDLIESKLFDIVFMLMLILGGSLVIFGEKFFGEN